MNNELKGFKKKQLWSAQDTNPVFAWRKLRKVTEVLRIVSGTVKI
jgi:hypothetical protein